MWTEEAYLVQCLAVLVQARVDWLEVFLYCIQRLLERVLEFGEGQRRRLRIWFALVSRVHGDSADRILTSCNVGASCSEHVNRLLDMIDAGREVGAALQQLYLLPEVVHGVDRE